MPFVVAVLAGCTPAPAAPAPSVPATASAPTVTLPVPAPAASTAAEAPLASVTVATVRSGPVVDAVEADSVRVLAARGADESIAGVARFAASAAPVVRAGVSLEVVFDTNPNAYREAKVESVAPATDGSIEATFRARRLSPRAIDAIRPGAAGRAYLRQGQRADRALLRSDALRRDGGQTYALRVVPGRPARVERRAVTLGRPADPRPGPPGALVEIAAGLQPGEEVFLDGPLDLKEGQPVEVAPAPHRTGIPRDECNQVRFVVQAEDTVVDTRLRIVWQRHLSPALMTHDDAERACRSAGMRLPRRDEIESLSIEQLQTHACAMDPGGDYFWTGSPGEYVDTYWTASPLGSGPSSAGRKATASVRCVRDLAP